MPAPAATSLIDAVDDANMPIGTVPREGVFRAKANFRTVHVLVFNAQGQLLLQRLGARRSRHPLSWGSSVAGYLHSGEDYRTAAERRLREELTLTTPVAQLGVTAMPDQGVTKFIGVFQTSADRPVIAEPRHIEELRFLSPSELATEIQRSPDSFTASLLHVLSFVSNRGVGRVRP